MNTQIEITAIELKIKHIRKAIIANKEAYAIIIGDNLIGNRDTQNIEKYYATYQKLIDYKNELSENNFTFKALNDYLSKTESAYNCVIDPDSFFNRS